MQTFFEIVGMLSSVCLVIALLYWSLLGCYRAMVYFKEQESSSNRTVSIHRKVIEVENLALDLRDDLENISLKLDQIVTPPKSNKIKPS